MQTIFRKPTVAWPLVIFFLLPTLTHAETAVQAWVQRYHAFGNGSDGADAVAVDGNNNVIVTGTSYGGSGSLGDYVTIKYSSAGVPLWTNRYNGPGNGGDHPAAVAVDGSNNVIVTGDSIRTNNSWPHSDYDYATIKYSSAGEPLWTNRYIEGSAHALAVDSGNNVIVTGGAAGGGGSGERLGGGRQQQRDRDGDIRRR
jgi:hypothetical protein